MDFHKILLNQRGAMTIVFLMLISSIFVVMMGIAGVRLLETAKIASKTNEAYNYLVVMEELGQSVNRARSLGRDFDCNAVVCPAGTVLQTTVSLQTTTVCPGGVNRNQYSLCVPNTDGDGVAEASDFCVSINGLNYCLTSTGGLMAGLSRLDLLNEGAVGYDLGRPPPYVEVAGGATQTTAGPLVPRNSAETWSPNVAWASTNEIFTTSCGGAASYTAANLSQYWLGCNSCNDPRIECWQMSMCRPSTTAVPTACAAGARANQFIMMYFQNNWR